MSWTSHLSGSGLILFSFRLAVVSATSLTRARTQSELTTFTLLPDTFAVFPKSSRPSVSIYVTATRRFHSLLQDLQRRFRAAKKVSGRHAHVRPAHTHALHRFVLGGPRDHQRVDLGRDGWVDRLTSAGSCRLPISCSSCRRIVKNFFFDFCSADHCAIHRVLWHVIRGPSAHHVQSLQHVKWKIVDTPS